MLPVANTAVSVVRSVQPEDGYALPTETTVYRRVRAVISEPSGSRTFGFPGSLTDVARKMTSDVMVLQEGDKVTDHADGTVYEVAYSAYQAGPLPHTTTALRNLTYQP